MSEILFVAHCDNPNCSLGYAQYNCPVCGEYTEDYGSLWWSGPDVIRQGNPFYTTCPDCKAPLVVTYNAEEYEYEINPHSPAVRQPVQ